MKKISGTRVDGDCKFTLAIVKDIVEGGDGTRYFGSLMGWSHYAACAERYGWVIKATLRHSEGFDYERLQITQEGRRVYERAELEKLPKAGRAYAWRWHVLPEEFSQVT